MARLEAMAGRSTHGGYDPTMTSDPLLVSKAVFDWWWIEQDHRGEYRRRVPLRLRAPSCFMVCPEEARSAAATVRVELQELAADAAPLDLGALALDLVHILPVYLVRCFDASPHCFPPAFSYFVT